MTSNFNSTDLGTKIPSFSIFLELTPNVAVYFSAFALVYRYVHRQKFENTQLDDRRRYRMRNLTCSLIHSTISGLWALCLLLNHPEMLRGTNVITYSSWWSHQLPLMSIGYFIYDCGDMLYNEWGSAWTYELLLHHSLSILAFGCSVSTHQFLPYAAVALLMEVNSIFLHLRTMAHLLRWEHSSKHCRILRALNLVTFIAFRFCVQVWMFAWLYRHFHQLHPAYQVIGGLGDIVFLIVNATLFRRLLKSDGWLTTRGSVRKSVSQISIDDKASGCLRAGGREVKKIE